MKNTRKTAIIDMDGTLLDSMPKMRADLTSAFARLGHSVTPEQLAKNKNWYTLATTLGISKTDFDREFDKRKSWEQSLVDGEAPLFEDTLPCLEALASQGVTLGLLTKSKPEYTHAKLKHYGLDRYFGDRIAVTDVKEKNKTREALELIERIGLSNISQSYFIGDRPEDVLVSPEVEREYALTSSGLYLNRSNKEAPEEVRGYRIIKSLAEVPELIFEGAEEW